MIKVYFIIYNMMRWCYYVLEDYRVSNHTMGTLYTDKYYQANIYKWKKLNIWQKWWRKQVDYNLRKYQSSGIRHYDSMQIWQVAKLSQRVFQYFWDTSLSRKPPHPLKGFPDNIDYILKACVLACLLISRISHLYLSQLIIPHVYLSHFSAATN